MIFGGEQNEDADGLTRGERLAVRLGLGFIALVSLAILVSVLASAASRYVNVAIKVYSPIQITVTPAAPTVACGAGASTVIATVTTAAGDGRPIALSLGGDTADFALAGTAPPTDVLVGSHGIAPGTCGTTAQMTITAVQE